MVGTGPHWLQSVARGKERGLGSSEVQEEIGVSSQGSR